MTTTILPTNNQAWGFWGTIRRHAEQSEAWALAMSAIGTATGCEAEAVRGFLDSRHGRHFADDVANGCSPAWGSQTRSTPRLPGGWAGASAKAPSAVARWMGWRIGKGTEREYGIPRDLPYLTGWVMNCAIEAEFTG